MIRNVPNLVYGISRVLYFAIGAYLEVDNPEEWEDCPNCGSKPLVWTFNNGRSTACMCGKSDYDHFSIHAESINSVMENSNNGTSMENYNTDDLKNNWNHWVKTGEELFLHASKRTDNRW